MDLREKLRSGLVIPAHPLALNSTRKLDERRQRALTRYYLAAGAGGIAVGVHTTQFAIRDPRFGLLEPVLALAAEESRGSRCGEDCRRLRQTQASVAEAELAARVGLRRRAVEPGRSERRNRSSASGARTRDCRASSRSSVSTCSPLSEAGCCPMNSGAVR